LEFARNTHQVIRVTAQLAVVVVVVVIQERRGGNSATARCCLDLFFSVFVFIFLRVRIAQSNSPVSSGWCRTNF
jgi:uncharacterized membrane protein YadS